MKCPTCKDVTLNMSDRQGIEIDYCSECRGIWLDRGELGKIIECLSVPAAQQKDKEKESERHDHQSHGYYKKGKKRLGFLSELLDF